MKEHTEGPWNASPSGGHELHGQSLIIDEQTGANIAVVYGNKPGDADVAAAAPELLFELEAILDLEPDDEGDRIIPAGWLDGARAAVAKARAL